jgi:hypothetical protein
VRSPNSTFCHLANPIQARSGAVPGMAGRRRRSSVNRIEEKIKKCQKCQNPCNADPSAMKRGFWLAISGS